MYIDTENIEKHRCLPSCLLYFAALWHPKAILKSASAARPQQSASAVPAYSETLTKRKKLDCITSYINGNPSASFTKEKYFTFKKMFGKKIKFKTKIQENGNSNY